MATTCPDERASLSRQPQTQLRSLYVLHARKIEAAIMRRKRGTPNKQSGGIRSLAKGAPSHICGLGDASSNLLLHADLLLFNV